MMKSTVPNRFEKWIFQSFSVTNEGIALYRIFVAFFLMIFLLPSLNLYDFVGSLPAEFYNPPPGPMALFHNFPPEFVFYLLHFLLILSLISMMIGYKTKFSSILAGILVLVLKGSIYSIGKINHDLLIAVVPLVMAFSNWGRTFSVDSYLHSGNRNLSEAENWPFTLLAMFIGFMMFSAGFPKILGGWLDPSTQATYGHFFNQFFIKGRQDLLSQYALGIESTFIWELLDYGTVLFETGFLLAILHPKSTKIFICFAVIFHFSTMLLLNIAFLPNFLAYAAFLDWDSIYNKLREIFPKNPYMPVLVLMSLLGVILVIIFVGDQFNIPSLNSDLQISEFYILLVALPLVLYYLSSQLLQFASKRA